MPPRAQSLSPDERRASIIARTRPLLLEQGPGVSTKQIAAACGIAEGTIFRVFDSKDALIHAVVDDTLEPATACHEIAAIDHSLPMDERVAALVRVLHAHTDAIAALFIALHTPPPTGESENASHRPRKRPEQTAVHERRAAEVTAAIIDVLGPDADGLRVSPAQAAAFIRGVAIATRHPLFSDGTLTDPTVIAHLIVHGLEPQERPC